MLLFSRVLRPLRSFRELLLHFLAVLQQRRNGRRRRRSRERPPHVPMAAVQTLETRTLMSAKPVDLAGDSNSQTFEAANDTIARASHGWPHVINVLANDSGSGLRVISVSQPDRGTTSIDTDTGFVRYTPPEYGFVGTEQFQYTVRDTSGAEAGATVTMKLYSLGSRSFLKNFVPIARDDEARTMPQESVLVDVLANDTDTSGPVRLADVLTAEHGTVVRRPNVSDSVWQHWRDEGQSSHDSFEDWYEATVGSASSLQYQVEYTPDNGFSGTDTFDYIVNDSLGAQARATVTVTVDALPDPPETTDDQLTVMENTTVVLDVLTNDSFSDQTSIRRLEVGQAANGRVVPADDPTDGVVYTPFSDFVGLDSFTYTVDDQYGRQSTATVTVAVTADPDKPIARDDEFTTSEQTPVALNLTDNDSSPVGSQLNIINITPPAHGTLDASGIYVADADFLGTDTLTYTVEDAQGRRAQATATIRVMEFTGTVTAADDQVFVEHQNAEILLDVLANDSESAGAALRITDVTTPTAGTIRIVDGDESLNERDQLMWTPPADFAGRVEFDYTIENSAGVRSSASVQLEVAIPVRRGSDSLYRGRGRLTLSNGFRVGAETGFVTPSTGNYSVVVTETDSSTEVFTDEHGIDHSATTTWTWTTTTTSNVDHPDRSRTWTETYVLDTVTSVQPVRQADAVGQSSTTTSRETYRFEAIVGGPAVGRTSYTYEASGTFRTSGHRLAETRRLDPASGEPTVLQERTDWTDQESYATRIFNTTFLGVIVTGTAESSRQRHLEQTDSTRTISSMEAAVSRTGDDVADGRKSVVPSGSLLAERALTWTWDTNENTRHDVSTDAAAIATESRTGKETTVGAAHGNYFYTIDGGRVDGSMDGRSESTVVYSDTAREFHARTVESSELLTFGGGTYSFDEDGETREGVISESGSTVTAGESTIVTTLTPPTDDAVNMEPVFTTTGHGFRTSESHTEFQDDASYQLTGEWLSRADSEPDGFTAMRDTARPANVADEAGHYTIGGTRHETSTESSLESTVWSGTLNDETQQWDYSALSGGQTQSGRQELVDEGHGSYEYPADDDDHVTGAIDSNVERSSSFLISTSIDGVDADNSAIVSGTGIGDSSFASDWVTQGDATFVTSGAWMGGGTDTSSRFVLDAEIRESAAEHAEQVRHWESRLQNGEWTTTEITGADRQFAESQYVYTGDGTYSDGVAGGTVDGDVSDRIRESTQLDVRMTIVGLDPDGRLVVDGTATGDSQAGSEFRSSGRGSWRETGQWLPDVPRYDDEGNLTGEADPPFASSYHIDGSIDESERADISRSEHWQQTLADDAWTTTSYVGETSDVREFDYERLGDGSWQYDVAGGSVTGVLVDNQRRSESSTRSTRTTEIDESGRPVTTGTNFGHQASSSEWMSSGDGRFTSTSKWLSDLPGVADRESSIGPVDVTADSEVTVQGTITEVGNRRSSESLTWHSSLADETWTTTQLTGGSRHTGFDSYDYAGDGNYEYAAGKGAVSGTIKDKLSNRISFERETSVDGVDEFGSAIISGVAFGEEQSTSEWAAVGGGTFTEEGVWNPESPLDSSYQLSGTLDESEQFYRDDFSRWTTTLEDGVWITTDRDGESTASSDVSFQSLGTGGYRYDVDGGTVTGTLVDNRLESDITSATMRLVSLNSDGSAVWSGDHRRETARSGLWMAGGHGRYVRQLDSRSRVPAGTEHGTSIEHGTVSGSIIESEQEMSDQTSHYESVLVDGQWQLTAASGHTRLNSESHFDHSVSSAFRFSADGQPRHGFSEDSHVTADSRDVNVLIDGVDENGRIVTTGTDTGSTSYRRAHSTATGTGDDVWQQWMINPDQQLPAENSDEFQAPDHTSFESEAWLEEETRGWDRVLQDGTWATVDLSGGSLHRRQQRVWQSAAESWLNVDADSSIGGTTTDVGSETTGYWFETVINGIASDGTVLVAGSGVGSGTRATSREVSGEGTYIRIGAWDASGPQSDGDSVVRGTISQRDYTHTQQTGGWVATMTGDGEWVFGETDSSSSQFSSGSTRYSGSGSYQYSDDQSEVSGSITESGSRGHVMQVQTTATADGSTTSASSGQASSENSWSSQGSGSYRRSSDPLDTTGADSTDVDRTDDGSRSASAWAISGSISESRSRSDSQQTSWNNQPGGVPQISGRTSQSGHDFDSREGSGRYDSERDEFHLQGDLTERDSSLSEWNFNTTIDGYDADGNVMQSGTGVSRFEHSRESGKEGTGAWSRWGEWSDDGRPPNTDSNFAPAIVQVDLVPGADGFQITGEVHESAMQEIRQSHETTMRLQNGSWITTLHVGTTSSEQSDSFRSDGTGSYVDHSNGTRVSGGLGEASHQSSHSSFVTHINGLDPNGDPLTTGSGQVRATQGSSRWHSGSGDSLVTGRWANNAPEYQTTVAQLPATSAPGTYASTVSITESDSFTSQQNAVWDYVLNQDAGDWDLQETNVDALLDQSSAYQRREQGTYTTVNPTVRPAGTSAADWQPPASYELLTGVFHANRDHQYESRFETSTQTYGQQDLVPQRTAGSDEVPADMTGSASVRSDVMDSFNWQAAGTAHRDVDASTLFPDYDGDFQVHVSGDVTERGNVLSRSMVEQQLRWNDADNRWQAVFGTGTNTSETRVERLVHIDQDVQVAAPIRLNSTPAGISDLSPDQNVHVLINEDSLQHDYARAAQDVDAATGEWLITAWASRNQDYDYRTSLTGGAGRYQTGLLHESLATFNQDADDDALQFHSGRTVHETDFQLQLNYTSGGTGSAGESEAVPVGRLHQEPITRPSGGPRLLSQTTVKPTPDSGAGDSGGRIELRMSRRDRTEVGTHLADDGTLHETTTMDGDHSSYFHFVTSFDFVRVGRGASVTRDSALASVTSDSSYTYSGVIDREDGQIIFEDGTAERTTGDDSRLSYSAAGSTLRSSLWSGLNTTTYLEKTHQDRAQSETTYYVLEGGDWTETGYRRRGQRDLFTTQTWTLDQAYPGLVFSVHRDRGRTIHNTARWDFTVTHATGHSDKVITGSKSGTFRADHYLDDVVTRSNRELRRKQETDAYSHTWFASPNDPDWTSEEPREWAGAFGGTRITNGNYFQSTRQNAAASLAPLQGYSSDLLASQDYDIRVTFTGPESTGLIQKDVLSASNATFGRQDLSRGTAPTSVSKPSTTPSPTTPAAAGSPHQPLTPSRPASPQPAAGPSFTTPSPPALPGVFPSGVTPITEAPAAIGRPSVPAQPQAAESRYGLPVVALPTGTVTRTQLEHNNQRWTLNSKEFPSYVDSAGLHAVYCSDAGDCVEFLFPHAGSAGDSKTGPVVPSAPGAPVTPPVPAVPSPSVDLDLPDTYERLPTLDEEVGVIQRLSPEEQQQTSRSRYQRRKFLDAINRLAATAAQIRERQADLDRLTASLDEDPTTDWETRQEIRRLEKELDYFRRKQRRQLREASQAYHQIRPEERAAIPQMLASGLWNLDDDHLTKSDRDDLRRRQNALESNFDRIVWLQRQIVREEAADEPNDGLLRQLREELAVEQSLTPHLLSELDEIQVRSSAEASGRLVASQGLWSVPAEKNLRKPFRYGGLSRKDWQEKREVGVQRLLGIQLLTPGAIATLASTVSELEAQLERTEDDKTRMDIMFHVEALREKIELLQRSLVYARHLTGVQFTDGESNLATEAEWFEIVVDDSELDEGGRPAVYWIGYELSGLGHIQTEMWRRRVGYLDADGDEPLVLGANISLATLRSFLQGGQSVGFRSIASYPDFLRTLQGVRESELTDPDELAAAQREAIREFGPQAAGAMFWVGREIAKQAAWEFGPGKVIRLVSAGGKFVGRGVTQVVVTPAMLQRLRRLFPSLAKVSDEDLIRTAEHELNNPSNYIVRNGQFVPKVPKGTRVEKNIGGAFEDTVKDRFRKKIIRQNEVIRDGSGKVLAEIDFETAEALVEVGTSLGGKTKQLHRLAEIAKQRGKRLDVIYGSDTAPGTLRVLQESLWKKFGNRVRFIPHPGP